MMTVRRQNAVSQLGEPLIRSLAECLPAGFQTGMHRHEWGQLVHAVSGALAVNAMRQRWVVPTHCCLWLPPEVDHDLQTLGECRLRTIYLNPALATSLSGDVVIMAVSPLFRELLVEITRRGVLFEADEQDRCFATLVITQAEEPPRISMGLPLPSDQSARLVADRVCLLPGNQATLAELSRDTGASERTIERRFTKETGLSFGRWRQQARLQHAIRLLSDRRPVTEVALDCGYGSVSAFITAFKSTFGVTPGQYLP